MSIFEFEPVRDGKFVFEPRKEGYKEKQDPAHLFILPFLIQDKIGKYA